MASAQQVLEFSRAFLNGQSGWCVVTLIKTFMEETGIHDDAEMVAVGGYVSRPKHWRAWTTDWNSHKRKVPNVGLINTPQAGVAPPDYSGLVEQNYKAQLAQSQATAQSLGGLFGLGGQLLKGLPGLSDRSDKTDIEKLLNVSACETDLAD
jgi:hypothetical protein